MDTYKIGICGLGFVGNAIYMTLKDYSDIELYLFDLYKNIGTIDKLLASHIVFICLPTPYNDIKNKYDITELEKTLLYLNNNEYKGIILIKSTLEPTTIDNMSKIYNLKLIHNPEFLTARTAIDDFKNQKHIILGINNTCDKEDINTVMSFYNKYFDAKISCCNSNISECVKLFSNSFYAVKVQFFTELYLLCNKLNIDYNTVKNLMLNNNWINPMHTDIPGPDGNISYGGLCFPKDTNALNSFMEKNNTPHQVLNATIKERNIIRND